MTAVSEQGPQEQFDFELSREFAAAYIEEFLALDVDTLRNTQLTKRERELLGVQDDGKPVSDTLHRRLALSMRYLDQAIRFVTDVRSSEYPAVQALHTGSLHEVGELTVSPANEDCGVCLSFTYNPQNEGKGHYGQQGFEVKAHIPSYDELIDMMHSGDVRRDVEGYSIASETDFESAEWNIEQIERVGNGGIALRKIDIDRALSVAALGSAPENNSGAFYRRHVIEYAPYHHPSALGIERYLELTQYLLARLMRHVEAVNQSSGRHGLYLVQ